MTSYSTGAADDAAVYTDNYTADNAVDRALISADKVEGTAVYNHADDRLGTVHSIYIDKRSGEVAYVAMSFGGFLGIGEKYHPLPWDLLDYDTGIGGYRVDLDRDALIDAPSYDQPALAAYDFDRDAGGIDAYYSRSLRSAEADRATGDTQRNPRGFYSARAQAERNDGAEVLGPAGEGAELVRDYERSEAGRDLPRRDA